VRPVLLACLAAAGALTGCSSSHSASPVAQATASTVPPLPSVACPASARTAFAKGVSSNAVSVQSDVTSGFSTCDYRTTAAAAGSCTAATVTINTSPQPFKDFQRWVVETAQNDTTAHLGDGYFPHEIDGVGVEAGWVPATRNLETANNERWIAVRLTCPKSGPQSLALAKDLARAALNAPTR
jgi:hypothetical protein